MIAVQDRLLELLPEKIAYLAEDWGQLDFYNERPPVNFPCVLIDIAEAEFSDCTRKVQLGEAILTVRVAHFDPVNISALAPNRNKAFRMFVLLRLIYTQLQGLSGEGFRPYAHIPAAVKREDAIREYVMQFRFGGTDNAAYKPRKRRRRPDRHHHGTLVTKQPGNLPGCFAIRLLFLLFLKQNKRICPTGAKFGKS